MPDPILIPFLFNLSTDYTSRRIIGLPSESYAYQGTTSGTLMSKVTYVYDGTTAATLTGTTQHDTTNYGTGFNYRGNVTRTWRWDVAAPESESARVSSQTAYNIAGSPVSQIDPRGRVTELSFTDVFNSTGNPTTYAYPTTVTDPGGNSSSIKYRYDIGANVEATSPTPEGEGNSMGKKTERTYSDLTGRIEMEKVVNTGAYTRYDYAESGNAITTYSTIMHEGSGLPGTSDEVATLTEFDGAGRLRRTRTDNPDSSSVYTAKQLQYDILGRVTGETVPTLVNASWEPTGDDYRNGDWKWNLKEYDWKGRVTRSIPSDSDSTGNDGKDTVFSYLGCGCAGGQETTISGPQADAIDMGGGTTITTGKRKTQKIVEDILGRAISTEVRSLDGTNLYSTTTTTYNGRDQVTSIAENDGTATQTSTMSYDGHGRLSALHKPEWYGSSTSDPRYTTTTYNADDTVATVTDPRGAVTTYTYETESSTLQRPLVTGIAYAAPSPNPSPSPTYIPPSANVTLEYDDAGNRTLMTDGTGELSYQYDELSRLKTETKLFADELEKAIEGGYTLSYDYHLNGTVKKITDPFGHIVTYSADKVGRMTDIGTGTGSLESTYVSDIAHRSFGAVKSMTMSTSNPTSIAMTYDDALRPLTYTANNSTTGTGGWVQNASYTYHKDGAVKTITDNAHTGFNQTNDYDFAGRLKKNNVGSSGATFTQTMDYDAFNNLTDRDSRTYDLGLVSFDATYLNNRKSGDFHDAAGHVIGATTSTGESSSGGWYNDVKSWYYDSAGRMSRWAELGPWAVTQRGGETTYDGDGRPAKYTEMDRDCVGTSCDSWENFNFYYLYSSVTGQRITDLTIDGTYYGHRVYMGDTVIYDAAYQGPFLTSTTPEPYWGMGFKVTDPITGSTQELLSNGAVPSQTTYPYARNELAGLGTSIPPVNPESVYQPNYHGLGSYAGIADSGFQINGAPVTYSTMMGFLRSMGLTFAGDHIVAATITQTRQEMGSIKGSWDGGDFFPDPDNPDPKVWWEVRSQSISFNEIRLPGDDLSIRSFFRIVSSGANSRTLRFKDPSAFREHFSTILNKGECKNKINALLAEIGKLGTAGQELVAATIDKLFVNIDSQKGGGFRIDLGDSHAFSEYTSVNGYSAEQGIKNWPGGGGGVTFRNDRNPTQRYVYNYGADGWSNDSYDVPKQIQRMGYQSFLRTVHEMFHAAGKTNNFEHDDMDQAAKNLGAQSFTDFVRKACIPQKYW